MADDPTPPPDTPPVDTPPPDPLGDAGKKALEAERQARRDAEKQLRDTQARVKELEDRDKSDVDKLRDENESLRQKVAESEAKTLRSEVAADKGLTPAQARRLVGATREELEADADEILEAFPVQGAKPPPPTRKPVADLSGGTDPTEDPVETDPAKLAASVPRL